MKVIHEKDYVYKGKDGEWYVFESVPKRNFYPERLLEVAAKYIMKDGSFRYFDPIDKMKSKSY